MLTAVTPTGYLTTSGYAIGDSVRILPDNLMFDNVKRKRFSVTAQVIVSGRVVAQERRVFRSRRERAEFLQHVPASCLVR